MATRSTIAAKIDGKFQIIYCHWGGYPEHNGKILLENYTEESKIKALLTLGPLSSLGKSIECPAGHSFDTPVKGYTVAYNRDRGDDIEANTSYPNYKAAMLELAEEYNYLWKDGTWRVNGKSLKLKKKM